MKLKFNIFKLHNEMAGNTGNASETVDILVEVS